MVGMLIVVEGPGVLERGCANAAEHVHFRDVSLRRGRGCRRSRSSDGGDGGILLHGW